MRQNIVEETDDWVRLRDRLAETVERFQWELLAFVFMTNHLHLFVQTPQPNLLRGMQHFLSSYANWSVAVIAVPDICCRGGSRPKGRKRDRTNTVRPGDCCARSGAAEWGKPSVRVGPGHCRIGRRGNRDASREHRIGTGE